jgi:molybdopterin converting factor small subunit
LDWSYEPAKATRALLDQEVGAVKEELNQLKQMTTLERFKSEYKTRGIDVDKTSQDPEFLEWVEASRYRTRLFNKNVNGLDIEAASDLLDAWEEHIKETSSHRQEVSTQNELKRKSALKDAALEKGASTGSSRKKMWSSRDIINMRLNDPDKYKAHYDEIMQAYAEDRVK